MGFGVTFPPVPADGVQAGADEFPLSLLCRVGRPAESSWWSRARGSWRWGPRSARLRFHRNGQKSRRVMRSEVRQRWNTPRTEGIGRQLMRRWENRSIQWLFLLASTNCKCKYTQVADLCSAETRAFEGICLLSLQFLMKDEKMCFKSPSSLLPENERAKLQRCLLTRL